MTSIKPPSELARLQQFMDSLPDCPHGCRSPYPSPTFRVTTLGLDGQLVDSLADQVTEIIARHEAEGAATLAEHIEREHAGVGGPSGPAVVEEYGHLMSGGGVHTWLLEPDMLEIYPLAKRIEHGKRHGGTVLRRRVIVVDDWEEVQ